MSLLQAAHGYYCNHCHCPLTDGELGVVVRPQGESVATRHDDDGLAVELDAQLLRVLQSLGRRLLGGLRVG